MRIVPEGPLGVLGVAGFFFESNELPYEEFDYDGLKARFPEGDYAVRGMNVYGTVVGGSARFTTVVPIAPVILGPGQRIRRRRRTAGGAAGQTFVRREQVTESRDGRPVEIAGYEVILVNEDCEGSDDSFGNPTYGVHVEPDRTELLVPAGVFDPETTYEIEILAFEENGNQTIAGTTFFETAK